MKLDPARRLLEGPLSVAHLGIEDVLSGARAASAEICRVDFTPPAGGDHDRISKLIELNRGDLAGRIDAANQQALERLLESRPMLVGVGIAREVIPGMEDDLFLHAGPPIDWERMCGPLKGAIIGGALLEGLARTPEQAEQLAASGRIRFEPCHHHQAVGPMAGLVTPSMPVWIIEDQNHRAFCTLNEGLGKVLRYGAYAQEVLDRLNFMAKVLAPALKETLEAHGPVDLKLLMAQALQMGDEGHNRNRAGTSLLFRELAPSMVELTRDPGQIARVLKFIDSNDHFFLNLSMPMAKCMLMALQNTPDCSLVSIMARNGTDFGLQLASLPNRWFTGPASRVDGLYFPGFSQADANPDIGDSTIMETAGIGAFAMAAAPAIVQFVGGSASDALQTTRQMAAITVARNPTWAMPALGFAGAPTGIDIRKVIELNRLPAINTGIASKLPGIGQVGAGLTRPPWECFNSAFEAFFEHCTRNR